jgi:hypothetical protein
MISYEDAMRAHPELAKYGSNAVLLLALQLRFPLGEVDIDSVAADALTDGYDDKKCDLVYVDPGEGIAVVAQGYMAQGDRTGAPANKASDLNTAVAWLLTQPVHRLPQPLQSAADRLREALGQSQIRSLHLWYVHNLPETQNVNSEMQTAASTAKQLLAGLVGGAEVEVAALEVRRKTFAEWYQAAQVPIIVTKEIEVTVPGGYQLKGSDWAAYVTAVPATWLHGLYKEYGMDLFSANVRGYLGSRHSDKNINFGIKQTAQSDPSHFWTFNNGITALVHDFQIPKGRGKIKRLTIRGISVVNGAQTTGALGTLDATLSDTAMVPARFVKCNAPATVLNIIKFNNSQNRVTAPDFRSNDAVQNRLRLEFRGIPDAEYTGGRRGDITDAIKRPANLIPSETAAQAMAAFHQQPVLAYNGKSEIWESHYSTFFSERTTARHIVFCYSLLRAIDTRKIELSGMGSRTVTEEQQLSYLRKRGSNFLLIAAIGGCLETYLGRSIPDRFLLNFGAGISHWQAATFWKPIVESSLSFYQPLDSAIGLGLKSNVNVPAAIQTFTSLMEATKSANKALFEAFAATVQVN